MFGIRNIWRFAALVAFGAVVAPVTAAPTQSTSIQASPPVVVQVSPALNHATFNVKTGRASRITIFFGTDRANMISKEVSTFSISRSVRLTPLAPATKYFYSVVATDRSGKLVGRHVGAFNTGAVRPATLTVANGRFRLNGVPFFPIMAVPYNGCPAPSIITDSVSMGVNVMDSWWDRGACTDYQSGRSVHWPTSDELHGILRGRVWWMIRNDFGGDISSLPELLDFRGELFLEKSVGSLWGCSPADSSASGWYTRLERSVASHLRQGQATVYWSSVIARGGVKSCMTAQRLSAQFWTSTLAGAAGMEYGNHHVADPEAGVDVRPDVLIQAGREARRLETLYPVILTGVERRVVSSSDSIIAKTWNWGGGTYAVAVNTENKPVTATIKWPGLSGTVKVLWQDRSKKLVTGGISERFGAHEVHIYQLP